MGIDFTTETERKRCKQIDRCQELLQDVTDSLGFGIDTRKATNRLIKLRNYLNKELPDKKVKAKLKEWDDMLKALVRIGNWCAQDLAECAPDGNYAKTLEGLCEICRPFMEIAKGLEEYGGPVEKDGDSVAEEPVPALNKCPRCGTESAVLVHPAFDGGSYVSCMNCHFSPQKETWAPTDAKAAKKWNEM